VPASSPAQRRALAVFALVSVVALLWLARPVSTGLFFGTLLAFSLASLYEALSARLKRPALAALLLSLVSGVVMLGALGALVYFLVVRGIVAASAIALGFGPEGALRKLLARLDELARSSPFGPIDVTGRTRLIAAEAASELTSWAGAVAGATFAALLTLFFTVITCFFMLRNWAALGAGAERMLPLHPLNTRLVLADFQKVGREVFVGTILTGAAQGILGGVSYAVADVPEAALLGALTAIASLIPLVGTALVWVPVGVALMMSGHPIGGVVVLGWGAVMVGVVGEYVIRPRLVGGRGHMPTLITFVSLFGGVQVFGVTGLIVGPVIASVALAVLRAYDRELRATAPESSEKPIAGD
jgi:predicted PurR-regulated permease PerM